MKRLTLFFALALTAGLAYPQQNKVVSAYNYLKYYERDKKAQDLINAKQMIDEASAHEQTMGKAKTWNYRGNVYMAIADSKDEKIKAISNDALNEAFKSYAKSIELDDKKEFTDLSRQNLGRIGYMALNRGVDQFSAKSYDQALSAFETSIEVSKMLNRTDTQGVYNAALACEKLQNYTKASEYYNQLISWNYGGPNVYFFQSQALKKCKQDDKAQACLQAGRKAYPNDKNLIIEELNFYLSQGKNQEALNNLNLAVQADPTNHVLHFSLGSIYDNLANPQKDQPQPAEAQYNDYTAKAEAAYKKALEIKPDYFDAMYNLGALYFNQGVKLNEMANSITDNAKYAKEIKKADEKFAVALPYLEKALELQPDDRNTLLSLKQLYARTNQTDKYNQVKEKLSN